MASLMASFPFSSREVGAGGGVEDGGLRSGRGIKMGANQHKDQDYRHGMKG